MTDPFTLGAAEAAARIRKKTLTSRDLVASCLDRIAARDGEVQAWIAIDPDSALAEAEARDRALKPLGPLHGVPVAIKDVIDTAGLPTAYGSPIYAGHRPVADAACVAALRRAGAVVLGKTATAEFASVHPPATTNPHDRAHTPGGSSSGSAAAVADFMAPLALGTQTAGSVIRPAAFCGVVGFKPSYNLVNRAGLKFSAESLDTIGFMARDVADAALVFGAVLGRAGEGDGEGAGGEGDGEGAGGEGDGEGAGGEARRLRVGLYRTDLWDEADPGARDVLERAAKTLAQAGLDVDEYVPEAPYSSLHATHATIIRYEAARAMAWEYENRRALLSDRFRARIAEGLTIAPDAHAAALHAAGAARTAFDAGWGAFDVLITPSARGTAPHGLASTGDATFNGVWTLLGVPCIHLPCTSENGLPLGVQLIGRRHDDRNFLHLARRIEGLLATGI